MKEQQQSVLARETAMVNKLESYPIVEYHAKLVIRNGSSLPSGRGCRYLLCIKGQGEELVAKQWKRKMPAKLGPGEVLVVFGD